MISVVIPLYNKEISIAHTIECVLAQTYHDFEVVVVDDGSTDRSAEIVKQFSDPRIRLVSQSNGGVSAARNTGIREAKSEYIAFLDADDEWQSGHLKNLASLIQRYPQCKAFATNYRNNQEGRIYELILNKIPFSGESGILSNYFEVCSCSQPPVWSSAVCVERELLLSIGGFPVGIKSGEDLLTWARISVKTDWAYSMIATATYIMPEGNTLTERPVRQNDEGDPVGKELLHLLDTTYPRKSELKHFIGRFYKMKASNNLRYGMRWQTLKECMLSLKYRPFAMEIYPIILLALLPTFIQKRVFSIHSHAKVADNHYSTKIMDEPTKRLLIFHPVIAPYRIDFFNALFDIYDTAVCMFWRNLKDQTFDYAKIEAQLKFKPHYLVREELGLFCWLKSIWQELSRQKANLVLGAEFGLSTIIIILHRFFTNAKYKIVIQCDDSFQMVSQNNHFTKRHALAIKLLLPHVDQVITPEPRVSSWYRNHYGKGTYFPIICDDWIARERQERTLPISDSYVSSYHLEGKRILLFVGRLVPIKNIEFAVKAFADANIKDAAFVIVGSGELQDSLTEMTAKYDNVIMVGRYEGNALYAWYNVAQVFTLPSVVEPFGAVTNEALIAGCKCLVSKDAGSNCLIKDGMNGYTIDPHNTNDFKEKLIKIMNDTEPLSLPLKVKPNMMVENFKDNIDRLVSEINNLSN